MVELDPDPKSYSGRANRLTFSDSLYAVGKFDECMQVIKSVQSETHEPLLKSIALQCEGEFWARHGDCTRALPILLEAQSLMPEGDCTIDTAILMKWLGYTYCRLAR